MSRFHLISNFCINFWLLLILNLHKSFPTITDYIITHILLNTFFNIWILITLYFLFFSFIKHMLIWLNYHIFLWNTFILISLIRLIRSHHYRTWASIGYRKPLSHALIWNSCATSLLILQSRIKNGSLDSFRSFVSLYIETAGMCCRTFQNWCHTFQQKTVGFFNFSATFF